MEKHTTKTIHIDHLFLDLENFRLGVLPNQREVVIKMAKDLDKKETNLMEHIAKNGLSPIEKIVVVPIPEDEKSFCVVEGNRRILALKALADRTLLNGTVLENEAKKLYSTLPPEFKAWM